MKKTITILFVLLFSQNLFSSDNEEFRATWVITWEHINSGLTAEQNMANVQKILDNHKKANMNAVLWQCRQSGTAYYNSSYEPWGYYAGYGYPGYDPLAYAIEEAHKRGLELHGWFNVFQTSSTEPGAPAAEHPEWICRDQDGNPMTTNISLSPGLEAVRDYTIKIAMEIVRNYDIDGLHLDYVRWNEYSNSQQSHRFAKLVNEKQLLDGMITEEQLKDLVENRSGRYLYDIEHPFSAGVPQGFSTWEDWWRWSVTEFVRVLHDSIQAVKPWVRLSPAALGNYNWGGISGWNGYYRVYQDAALWFNEGYIDQLTPMHYHWTTPDGFYGMLVSNYPDCWSQYIQKGINDGRLFTVGPGSYQFADQNVWARHPSVIEKVRTVPWVDGFQFFSYGSWEDYKYWDEAGATFFDHQTKIRATKLIVTTSPEPPTINMTKLDSLNYQIDVAPPLSITTDHRFAIYRSPDDNFDVNSDEIIDIHFGTDSYSFIDQFTGTQDYNGAYYYYATALDRYWNESDISNVAQSDAIPSFAPTVIATTPAQGDTVPINCDVIITFSKTMEINTVQHAISLVPEVTITQLIWSGDHKKLTILFETNFDYTTDYTLTISPVVTDINGKPLDGNGDGNAGDAFVLNFRTEGEDITGPVILNSYPNIISPTTDFISDEVITFVFDEYIDPFTITDNSVILRQGEHVIPIWYVTTDIDEKSVLSIQSLDTLKRDTDYSITLASSIADTSGNTMTSDIAVNFKTSPMRYTEEIFIDKFMSTANWEQPSYSGSTIGIILPNTTFGVSTEAYLPASPARQRISAVLTYKWDTTASEFLLRDYASGSAVQNTRFDTSYVLQCYVFGDASYNKFRFSLREVEGQGYPLEVSKWLTIDWYGWKVIEWDLSDPGSVGTWLGNEIMDGKSYYVDSFQLTHDETGAVTGKIFFDNLRLVKKSSDYIGIEKEKLIAITFGLWQNYPNPFNPTTIIPFDLSKKGYVVLKVYDILGRTVVTLINNDMMPGHHEVQFDGSNLASGIYVYQLEFNGERIRKQMLLIK